MANDAVMGRVLSSGVACVLFTALGLLFPELSNFKHNYMNLDSKSKQNK